MSLLSLIPRYLIALALTVGVYGIYGFLVAPLLEGESQTITRVDPKIPLEDADPGRIKKNLLPFLPEGGWERELCTTLDTPQATILFQEYDVLEDGSVELRPLSMFIKNPLKSDSAETNPKNDTQPNTPLIMRAPLARLKFERSLSAGGSLGDLEKGDLIGEVQVYRMPSEEGKDDGLYLSTTSVKITPEQISTVNDCEFQFGKSRGRGRQLTVNLFGPKSGKPNQKGTFSGVESIELARLYELHLDQGTEANAGPNRTPSKQDDLLGDTAGSVTITSDGPMSFDSESKTISFRKNVLVKRANLSEDQLACEQLDVLLARDQKESGKPEKLAVHRLFAAGSPEKPARIISKSKNASLTATTIAYDLKLNQVRLTSNEQVVLIREGQQIKSREIQYQFTEDGRMGDATILGPGSLVQEGQENGKGSILCQWKRQLRLTSDGDQKLLSLDSGLLKMDATVVKADQMNFWIWEVPEPIKNGQKPRWRFEPARFRATGQVNIESPELTGGCNEAQALWPRPTPLQANVQFPAMRHTVSRPRVFSAWQEQQIQATTIKNPPIPGDPPLTWRSSGSKSQNPASEPNSSSPSAWPSNQSVPFLESDPKPIPPQQNKSIRFFGNTVRLQMRGGEARTEVAEMTVDGDVVVQQQEKSPSGQLRTAMEFRGSQLKIETQPQDRYRLAMSGNADQSATVWLDEMRLQANAIFLDQMQNQLWVNGPGRLRMTGTPEQSPDVPSLRNSSSAASPTILASGETTVTWDGGMVFNGSTLYFETNVQSESRQTDRNDGTTTATATRCAGLSITLNRTVNFNELKSKEAPPNIEARRLIMVGQMKQGEVEFGDFWKPSPQARAFIMIGTSNREGQVTSNQEVLAPRVTYDASSSAIRCEGRGTVIARQISGGENRLTTAPTQFASSRNTSGSIEYIKVDYDESFTGNLDPKKHEKGGRKLEFKGNVHCFYTQTIDWESNPSESLLQQADPPAMLMDCDLLTLDQWTPHGSETTVDMVATGNARISGNQFRATAERISFSQSNVLVVLDAPIRANVEIWFADPHGGATGHAIAKTVTYNIETGECQWQQGKQIDYRQNGSPFGK